METRNKMIQILISFDLLPGVQETYHDFVVNTGMPFWRNQTGVRAVRGFRNILGSHPQIIAQVDCEDLDAAIRVLSSSEYAAIVEEQSKFVTNREVWLLEPTGRTSTYDDRGVS
jgi:hypothetical protein